MKIPWTHPIATRLDHLGRSITYEEAAKQVRNRLRSYSAESVAVLALELLRQGDQQSHEHLQTWPWITCLVVKLAFDNASIPLHGHSCPQHVFDRCRQILWNAQAGNGSFNDPRGGLYLTLRSMLQAQLPFQSKPGWEFIRVPALLRRLPEDHPSRRLFEQQFGMTPNVFICLSYAITAQIVKGHRVIHIRSFDKLGQAFGTAVERFFALFARDYAGLRTELQEESAMRLANRQSRRLDTEYNEFPWLSNFPLLKLNSHSFAVWHPLVFARGLENAAHRRLSLHKAEYSSSFSKVFEEYVLELIRESGVRYIDEAEYKRRYGGDKNAVEAIISQEGINIFVESKMTAYSSEVTTSGRAPVVWTGLKRVREAMKQGWMVSTAVRSGAFADLDCSTAREDFLIVVTSQQMMCATGEHFRRLFKPEVFDPDVPMLRGTRPSCPDAQQLARLPLKNIIIASIAEFELLMGAVGAAELDLLAFLRKVAQANEDPSTSIMFLQQMLSAHARLPQALSDARNEAEDTLRAVMGKV